MEQVGINGVQQVQYQPKAAATQPSFTANPPEQKEDGDKKLMNALLGLGAITAAGIGIYAGRHKLANLFSKNGKKVAEAVSESTQNIKPPKNEALQNSRRIISGVSTEAQEKTNKLTSNIQEAIQKQNEYDLLVTEVELGEKAIKGAKLAGKDRVIYNGVEMNISRAEGLHSNAVGRLKKIEKPNPNAINDAIAEMQTNGDKNIIQMQRISRKHSGISDENLAKIANSTSKKAPSESVALANQYDKYLEYAKKHNKTPMTFETFIQKQSKIK